MAANQFGQVSVGITANTSKLTSGLNDAERQLTGFGKMQQQLSRINLATSFLAVTRAAGLLYRSIRSVASATSGLVQDASNLTEEQNRVGIIFGDSAKAVQMFADRAAGIGLANTQALQAAGTFGTLFRNIGLTEAVSAKMSVSLTTLAADMASFNNVTTDDALRAVRSALVGEVEPIRRLGVVLNDATLRQKAFNMGLTDNVSKTLPPAIKLQAAYAAILEQTTAQQGDATRTSGMLAGQQRILGSNFANLRSQIGKALEPMMLSLVTGLNEVMADLRVLAQVFIDTFVESVKGMSKGSTAAQVFSGAIRRLAAGVRMLYGFFQLLYAFSLDIQRGFLNIGGAIYAFLDGFNHFFGQIIESFEIMVRFLITGLTWPIQKILQLLAKAADAAGQGGLGKSLRDDAKAMATLATRSTGLGEAIQKANEKSGFFGTLSDQAFHEASKLGREATRSFEDGMKNITDPLAGFDEMLFSEKLKDSIKGMIPIFGDIGAALGEGASEEIRASTEKLSAVLVGSSAGEAFRNAMMRGADPRLAANTDRQIADNTNRMANGIDNLPDALGGVVGRQIAGASIGV